MKFFAIFATLLAVTCALPRQWGIHEVSVALQDPNTDPAMFPYLQALLNELMMEAMGQPQATPVEVSLSLNELSEAIQSPNTDPALIPYLEHALNELMDNLIAGNQQDAIVVAFPAGLAVEGIVAPSPVVVPTTPVEEISLSLNELSAAIQSPNTDPALIPYLENALNELMDNLMAGNQQDSIIVAFPAGLAVEGIVAPSPVVVPTTPVEEISLSLNEISEALQNPNTDPALIPYLENALNELMDNLISGNQQDSIIVAVPAGLVPAIVAPAPVVEAPTPVEAPAASAPLVQIIVNVNQQEAAVVPSPVVEPTPVVVPTPVEVPAPVPVNPVDVIAVLPSPVGVDGVTAPEAINPVDVIAVIPGPVGVDSITAPEAINPVDVIAVIPGPVGVDSITAPEAINPVDVIAVIPGPVGVGGITAPEAINPVDVIAIIPPQINPIDVVAIAAPEINPIDIASPIPVVPAGVAGVVGPIL